MPPTHVVLRPFPGPGGPQLPGTEVDASEWRNTESLVKRRYLRPIAQAAARTPSPAERQADPDEHLPPAEPEPVGPSLEDEPATDGYEGQPEPEPVEDAPVRHEKTTKPVSKSKSTSAAARRKR